MQRLGAQAALQRTCVWFPEPTRWLTTTCNCSPRGSRAALLPLWEPDTQVLTHIKAQTFRWSLSNLCSKSTHNPVLYGLLTSQTQGILALSWAAMEGLGVRIRIVSPQILDGQGHAGFFFIISLLPSQPMGAHFLSLCLHVSLLHLIPPVSYSSYLVLCLQL